MAVVLLLACAACSPRLKVPATLLVSCEESSGCPEQLRCAAAISKCVRADTGDSTPPNVTAIDLSRQTLRRGATLVVSFDVDEELAIAPSVTLTGRPLAVIEPSAPFMYANTYTASGDEAEVDTVVSIEVYDLVANRNVVATDPVRFDFTPPSMTSAVSLSESSVRVSFSEVAVFTSPSFAFSPALTVLDIALASDGLSATLSTSPQATSVTYSLTGAGITDAAGNDLSGIPVEFSGGGAPPDSAPPQIVSPVPGDLAQGLTVTVTWTAPHGATSYVVDVATDPAFATIVATRVIEDSSTQAVFTVTEDITHYVRVRADTTAPGAFGQSSFEAIGDVVYVYCPDTLGSVCDNAGTAGNRSKPARTIGHAQALAAAFGIPRVDIASRGSGTPYVEVVSLSPGLGLYGGYDPTFTTRSGRTPVGDPASPVAVLFVGAHGLVTLDGLDFAAGDAPIKSRALSAESSTGLVANDCRFAAGQAGQSYGIELNTATITLTNCLVEGGGVPAILISASSIGLFSTAGTLIADSTVFKGHSHTSGSSYGVEAAFFSDFTITGGSLEGGTIDGTTAARESAGVFGTGSFVRLSNVTAKGGPALPSGTSAGVIVGDALIADSTVVGDVAGVSIGARVSDATALIDTEARASATATESYAVRLTAGKALLAFDTLVSGGSAGPGGNAVVLIEGATTTPAFDANLLYGRDVPGDGIRESAAGDPSAVIDEFVFGSPTALYHDNDSGLAFTDTCAGDFGVTACGGATLTTPTATGSVTTSSAATVVFTDPTSDPPDLSLKVGSPALGLLACPAASATLTYDFRKPVAFGNQAACDAFMPGTTVNGGLCRSTFLRNATELAGDAVGNDNGLCESNETCVMRPNSGHYAGSGALVSAAPSCPNIGAGGTVQNVVLQMYESNGN